MQINANYVTTLIRTLTNPANPMIPNDFPVSSHVAT